MQDADVPAWWQRLGLPGLIDVHTHFMPERVMDAVWAYFDTPTSTTAGPGRCTTGCRRPSGWRCCDALGVRAFTALLYPHKPGMARVAVGVGAGVRGAHTRLRADRHVLPRAGRRRGYVREALDAGTRVFKAHVQVGGYDPRDPLLDAGVGAARRGGRAGGRALRQRADPRRAHRAGPVRRGAARATRG